MVDVPEKRLHPSQMVPGLLQTLLMQILHQQHMSVMEKQE